MGSTSRATGLSGIAGASIVALGAALLLGACGGSSSTASTTSTTSGHPTTSRASPTSSAPTTTSAPPTTTSAPSTTTSHPAYASGAPCKIGQLTVTPLQSEGAAGSVVQVIGFVNRSAVACTLRGYPGVAALDASGRQVAQAARSPKGMMGGLSNGSTTPPVVTLTPGQTASAAVEGTDVPVGSATSCPSYPAFLVTPPDETHSVTVSLARPGVAASGFPGCSPITVNPVVPGATGRLP